MASERIRYSKSSDAPKLLQTAIALGVNGVTNVSTEVEKLAAIGKLQDDTVTYTNTETALLLESLANKVLISMVFKRMQFSDTISRLFFTEGTSVSAAKEVFDNQLLTPQPYDKDKRYPDQQTRANTLNTILTTVKRDFLTNTIPAFGIRGAFASDTGFGEWMASMVGILQESLQVELFKELTKLVQLGVKNTIVLDPATYNSWDKIFVGITGIAANMELPSKKYNMGFKDMATAIAAPNSRTNVTNMSSMIMMGSTDIKNALKGEVSPIKFHNEYFKLEKFKDYVALDIQSDHINLVADNSFEGYFRVNEMATQAWAGNKSVEYFLHYWYVFGSIPWANGVRIEFTNPDGVNTLTNPASPAPSKKNTNDPLLTFNGDVKTLTTKEQATLRKLLNTGRCSIEELQVAVDLNNA